MWSLSEFRILQGLPPDWACGKKSREHHRVQAFVKSHCADKKSLHLKGTSICTSQPAGPYRIKRSTAKHYKALRSTTKYYEVLRSITEYYGVLWGTTEYYGVPRSTTEYYEVLRSTTEYYGVLRSTTKYYEVLLRNARSVLNLLDSWPGWLCTSLNVCRVFQLCSFFRILAIHSRCDLFINRFNLLLKTSIVLLHS